MRILSIDGGGIRGIIPGQVLVSLEQKLQQLSNDPNKRIADVFDLIAGTSTGGILACLYLCPASSSSIPRRPRFSAAEAVALYLQYGDDVFDISLFRSIRTLDGNVDEKYSAETLEMLLKDYFGDVRLSELLKPCLITAYDITRRQAKFFNSEDVEREGLGRDFYIRDVARATSAVPSYFEPARGVAFDRKVYPLIDGGVFAPNPSLCACVEAFHSNPKLTVQDLHVLSLGTGAADKPYHHSEARNWGKLEWILPVLDIMLSGASETVDYQLKMLFESAGCPSQYLRLQVNLADFPDINSEMDNASEENMKALEKAGQTLAAKQDAQLTTFAKDLLGLPPTPAAPAPTAAPAIISRSVTPVVDN